MPGTRVTIDAAPKTIHDLGGFPRELYEVQYAAPGDPKFAHRVRKMLAPLPIMVDNSWGLDHWTWAVLRHVYPHADVPVVPAGYLSAGPQLSDDEPVCRGGRTL